MNNRVSNEFDPSLLLKNYLDNIFELLLILFYSFLDRHEGIISSLPQLNPLLRIYGSQSQTSQALDGKCRFSLVISIEPFLIYGSQSQTNQALDGKGRFSLDISVKPFLKNGSQSQTNQALDRKCRFSLSLYLYWTLYSYTVLSHRQVRHWMGNVGSLSLSILYWTFYS